MYRTVHQIFSWTLDQQKTTKKLEESLEGKMFRKKSRTEEEEPQMCVMAARAAAGVELNSQST